MERREEVEVDDESDKKEAIVGIGEVNKMADKLNGI